MKQRLKTTLCISAALLLLGGVYAIANMHGFSIPCMFHRITGLRCPGCGITHLFMDLLKLDIKAAFMDNPYAFIILPILSVILLRQLILYIKNGREDYSRFENMILIMIVICMIPYMIIRNIMDF
ncbi:MAG: DUF2752 domain-containing protein [Lachnospiraceae bacterium]|jgi:hypothetical protein|nr:DUF2752 domain-containing protein [Lachnospiraceae bacterium]MCR4938361.1 DUF2752 domain-containing protein [Lachnospiraceae bacterium]